jgi:hypothetical protein
MTRHVGDREKFGGRDGQDVAECGEDGQREALRGLGDQTPDLNVRQLDAALDQQRRQIGAVEEAARGHDFSDAPVVANLPRHWCSAGGPRQFDLVEHVGRTSSVASVNLLSPPSLPATSRSVAAAQHRLKRVYASAPPPIVAVGCPPHTDGYLERPPRRLGSGGGISNWTRARRAIAKYV